MLGNKNKFDKKVRFQKHNFQTQLKEARNYKRQPGEKSKSGLKNLFLKISRISVVKNIIFIFFLAGLVYIIYIPNFLYIKSVEISGLPQKQTEELTTRINTYLDNKSFLPQKNLLLTSKNKLKLVLKNDSNISEIQSIQKKWSSTLKISLLPRIAAYEVNSGQETYKLANDGYIIEKNQLGAFASSTQSSLKNIVLTGSQNYQIGEKAVNLSELNKINFFKQELPKISGSEIVSFKFENFLSPDWFIDFTPGFQLKINSQENLEKTLLEFKSVTQNLPKIDLQRLYYIDLRFKNKAYVCFKQTACSSEPKEEPAASSSPQTLNP
jgi:cell division septal protein FtsQ